MMDFTTASQSRIKSACEGEVTPITLNRDEQYATFAASDGSIYTATLDECTCTDFAMNLRGEQPCKHMIRLAMELGIMENAGYVTSTEAAMSKLYIGQIKEVIKEGDISVALVVWNIVNQLMSTKGLPGSDVDALACIGIPNLLEAGLCQTKSKGRIAFIKDVKLDLRRVCSTFETRVGNLILENMELSDVAELIKDF